jgi:hypothetical protein
MGKNTITPKLCERLIEELNINPQYTEHARQGLCFAWGCYLECSAALQWAKTMSDAGNWPTDIPPFGEYLIVDVFIGKTTWYNTYVKVFEPIDRISTYSHMKAWLDDDNVDDNETEDVWGILQFSYTMEDLREWLSNGGALKKKRNKCSSSPEKEERSKGKQHAHRKKNL